LRRRFSFMEIATTTDLSVEVTCLPVELLGVDAAAVFANIMRPIQGMQAEFEIRDEAGPVIGAPVRTEDQVASFRVVEAADATPYLSRRSGGAGPAGRPRCLGRVRRRPPSPWPASW
jgi:uroporphyrinogen decarboxylase